ncbi:MAG: heme exporter protein CcmB [Granulosicoccus sp.]
MALNRSSQEAEQNLSESNGVDTSEATLDARQSADMFSFYRRIFTRDLTLAARSTGQWLNPLLFFVIVVSLFPLGIGPGPQMLASIAPGVLWVSALLAMMLSLDALFAHDFRDGTLEQMVLSGQSLSIFVLGKVSAYWTISGLPLVLLSPLLAMMLQLPANAFGILMLSLLLGTLSLSFIGAIGAALTVSVNQGGILLSLLVLPLTVPVLIFGAGAVSAAGMGLSTSAQLSLLAAIAALSVSLAPVAIAGALRVGVSAGR